MRVISCVWMRRFWFRCDFSPSGSVKNPNRVYPSRLMQAVHRMDGYTHSFALYFAYHSISSSNVILYDLAATVRINQYSLHIQLSNTYCVSLYPSYCPALLSNFKCNNLFEMYWITNSGLQCRCFDLDRHRLTTICMISNCIWIVSYIRFSLHLVHRL